MNVLHKQQFDEIIKLFTSNALVYNKEKIIKVYKNIYMGAGSWIFDKNTKLNINIEFFQKIINLAPQEVEISTLSTADIFSIDLCDDYDENIYKYFEKLNEIFELNSNESILIVCAAGISRSSTIALAYLLKQKVRLN